MTYLSGAVITYAPDSAGRTVSAIDKDKSINYVTGATYDATNALTGSTYSQNGSFSGIVNSFSFNNRLQPATLWSSSPTRTLMYLAYDFHLGNGDNGNVYAITNNRDLSRNQISPTIRSTACSRPRTPERIATRNFLTATPNTGVTAMFMMPGAISTKNR
jgi:hypothetical protein